MLFDLKHAMYAMAGSAIGAIMGYFFGLVLYIVTLCSSVFAPAPIDPLGTTPFMTLVASAGVWPMMFAILIAAIGFFAGWFISHEKYNTPITNNSNTSNTQDMAITRFMDTMSALLTQAVKVEQQRQEPKKPPDSSI